MAKLAVKGGCPVIKELKVPSWPILNEHDEENVLEAVRTGQWGGLKGLGISRSVEVFEQKFAEFHHAKYAIGVSNGTIAIQLALRTLGVRMGDEVLVPALTFIASASAIAEVGAIPVFVDSHPDTLQISPEGIKKAITERTRGVVAVHYGGYPIDFDAILPIVKKHNLFLVEDCAHAHGTEWKKRRVGALGSIGAFSFQQSKSLTSGEGGVIVTDNEELKEKAHLLRNIGRVAGKLEYEHYILASNYRMTGIQAALLLSQMEKLGEQTEYKGKMGKYLASELEKIGGIRSPKKDPRVTKRGYYIVFFRYDKEAFAGVSRDTFLEALRAEGIPASNGYGMPLYRQVAFRKEKVEHLLPKNILGSVPDYESMYLPVVENFYENEQIALPHTLLLADKKQIQLVIDAVAKIKENIDELR